MPHKTPRGVNPALSRFPYGVSYNSGWFSICGNKMRAVAFAECIRRLKDRPDWKKPRVKQLDYPDSDACKGLRILRAKILAEAIYIKKQDMNEWIRANGYTSLDLVRLVLNQD